MVPRISPDVDAVALVVEQDRLLDGLVKRHDPVDKHEEDTAHCPNIDRLQKVWIISKVFLNCFSVQSRVIPETFSAFMYVYIFICVIFIAFYAFLCNRIEFWINLLYFYPVARLTRFEGRGHKNFQRVPPLLVFIDKFSKGEVLAFSPLPLDLMGGGEGYDPLAPPPLNAPLLLLYLHWLIPEGCRERPVWVRVRRTPWSRKMWCSTGWRRRWKNRNRSVSSG